MKELVKKYGYTGLEDYTVINWFTQCILTERERNKANMSVGYEHFYYHSRTEETIHAQSKDFFIYAKRDSHAKVYVRY